MVKSPVIVALDYPDASQAMTMAGRLDPSLCRVKVGKELFTREGPGMVEKLVERGFDVFLDLKFHDIPNTVVGACRAALDLGVWMVNVHASGGRRMMDAAREALATQRLRPLLIAVTLLTSLDTTDLAEIGFSGTADENVRRLAHLSADCGLDGVVCSSQEVATIRIDVGMDFKIVTPGIRPAGVDTGDQRRIMTPSAAMAAGSDYLVIGRPITAADSPNEALAAILAELNV